MPLCFIVDTRFFNVKTEELKMLFNCIVDEAFNFQVVATVYLCNVLYEMHEILEKRTRMVIKKMLVTFERRR